MMPDQVLSSEVIYDSLILPVPPQPSLLISNEYGGIALNDATQGSQVKVWTCTVIPSGDPLVPDDVVVYAGDVPETFLFSALGISEVSLAFDQNMHAFVAFVSQGVAKFYWYDSVLQDFRISNLPVGSTTPRATLDDHRELQESTSDIILVYIRDGNLYFRAQRDRYTIEYILYADIDLDIISPAVQWVKMNNTWRLQIAIQGNFYGS